MRQNLQAFFFLILLIGIGFLGCQSKDEFRLQVTFPDAQGLKNDAAVFYRGVRVGKVERVSLQSSSTKEVCEVVVDLVLTDPNVKVRQNDIIRATGFGLLGDKIIDIVPNGSDSPLVPIGSRLRGGVQQPLEGVNTLMELTGLTLQLNSLPLKKKEELIKTFHNLVDQATEETSRPEADRRLDWFREARFGMFIHWGLYAVPAGEWAGKKGYGEWIQFSAGIPGPEYVKLAGKFNPTGFSAKEWVSVAKEAGMKYMVITAKHHEGFCLFDSRLTDYDIVDATPYGRDPMKELAEECRRQGLTLCFYYSVQDWHHPEYPTLYTRREKQHPEGYHGFPKPAADFEKYLDYLEGQVRELLSNYGPVGIIWFDWYGDAFQKESEVKRAKDIVSMIHELQPQCLINNRFGGVGADYGTPEQQIPGARGGSAFEVCMTMNRHWGYNKEDNDWKDARTIVFNLCDIASKGGNYLLNVGPTAEGLFPDSSIRILKDVGRWTKAHREAIYGVLPGPDMRWEADIALLTRRPGKDYLHVFDWPKDRKIFYQYPFYMYEQGLKKAYLLEDQARKPLPFKHFRRAIELTVPSAAPDPINSVIVVEYERP